MELDLLLRDGARLRRVVRWWGNVPSVCGLRAAIAGMDRACAAARALAPVANLSAVFSDRNSPAHGLTLRRAADQNIQMVVPRITSADVTRRMDGDRTRLARPVHRHCAFASCSFALSGAFRSHHVALGRPRRPATFLSGTAAG